MHNAYHFWRNICTLPASCRQLFYMRYQTLTLVLGLLIISCSPTREKEKGSVDSKNASTKKPSTLGERTNGLTTVYDSIKGRPIFTLSDNVLVGCSESYNNWFEILLFTDISLDEYEKIDKLEKGKKLIAGDKVIGEVLTEMTAYGPTNYREAWIRLSGFIPKENIKPGTIVEFALRQYNVRVSNARVIKEYREFINDFGLDSTDQF